MQTESHGPKPGGTGYETRDANPRALIIFAVGLVLTLVVTFAVVVGVFRYFANAQSLGQPLPAYAPQRVLPPAPRLQVNARQDLERFRQQEKTDLNSYGWVDRKAGVVKIPIDRAMDLLLKKGLPVEGATAEK